MLDVKNLCVEIQGTPILKGLNLKVNRGEIHAIMGPNGCGKSTLSKVLAGHPDYEVTSGEILYEINGEMKNLLELEAHERAREGVFLSFQYPVEIPGITNATFLRESFNAICTHQGADPMDPYDFDEFIKEKIKPLEIDPSFLHRSVNEGFSGGEKKKNEVLQLSVLNPMLAILDEMDSGLDIDALKIVGKGVNQYKSPHNATILITHYQRLLNYIVPDKVHVMVQGQIVETGNKSLALKLESEGYDWVEQRAQG